MLVVLLLLLFVSCSGAQVQSGNPGTDAGRGSGEYCGMPTIRCAHLFQGGDAGAKITAAIKSLLGANARGGTVDARGVTDATMAGFAVPPGVQVLLPAREFNLTGTITVNQNGWLTGLTDGGLANGSRLNTQKGVSGRAIYLVHSAGRNPSQWCHKCRVDNIFLNMADAAPGVHGFEAYQMGENSYIRDVQIRSAPGCGVLIGAAGEAPNSQAGADYLWNVEANGSGVAGVCLRNMAGEFRMIGLSGDCNAKMFELSGWNYHALSLLIDYTKSESPRASCAGSGNDPWMLIDNFGSVAGTPVGVITYIGGRHTRAGQQASDWIRIQNMRPGSGPLLKIQNTFIQGSPNLIHDPSNGVTIPLSEVTDAKDSKILDYSYDGRNARPAVVSEIGRGHLRLRPSDVRATCSANYEGSLYYNKSIAKLCVCRSEGGDPEQFNWRPSDDYGGTCN